MTKHLIKNLAILLLLPTICQTKTFRKSLKLFAEGKEMEYKFPTTYERSQALQDGRYIRGNSIPTDVDVYYQDKEHQKVFVACPRFATGVPVTLGYVTEQQGEGGPKLQPYPDYTWHSSNGTDCSRITSVISIAIDECDRLWVLDNGRIYRDQVCPPQLLVFNLKTDRLLLRYRIPELQNVDLESVFLTIIVDVRDSPKGGCENTMAYMADSGAYGLIVYDFSCGESWRVENTLMEPVQQYETFTISGESFDLRYGIDGIAGMTLSPKCLPQKERLLYFHSLAGATENTVPLKILNNKNNWVSRPDSFPEAFMEIGSRGIQSASEAMDKNGNLFFGLMTPNAIVCWDSSTPYERSNFKTVALSKSKLQFPSGVKVITNSFGKEELWVLSNRNQKFQTTMRIDEVNFRILTIPLENILDGKKCQGPPLE